MRKFFRSLALPLALHLAGRFAVAYLWRTSLKTARVRAHRLAGLAWLLWGRKNRSQVIANIAKALPAREQETGQETEQRRGQATEVKATEVKATEVKATEVKATEAKAIARQSFALLLRNFADLGQTPRYSNRSLPLDERLLDPAIESLFATPTVWVTGHFAAWEAACGALARRVSVPCNFTARAFSDSWLTRQVATRRAIGAQHADGTATALFVRGERGDFARALRGVLAGTESAVFFSDQRQVGATRVKLLNQEVWLADTAVRLALRSGAALVCFRALDDTEEKEAKKPATDRRTGRSGTASLDRAMEVEFGPILLPPRKNQQSAKLDEAEVQALCQKLADWYSAEILRTPQSWLWTRKRFRL